MFSDFLQPDCFLPVGSCHFESPSCTEALHGGCLVSADVWALRWLCVLLSGLPQLERESPTMYNLLECSLIPSTICSFLFSCKNNENRSITFFPDVAHHMVVLDANISFSNLWSTAQFVLDRATTLRRIIFLFCFHVKWEIRIGMFKQGRSTQGTSSLGWPKDTFWYYAVISFTSQAPALHKNSGNCFSFLSIPRS